MLFKCFFGILISCTGIYAQQNHLSKIAVGICYGSGSEFKNKDYTYSNSYIQAQLYYSFNPDKKWEYQIALQPEINFAKHRLKNYYFIKPDEPDFEKKREEYLHMKDIREYILNVAFFMRYNFSGHFSMYTMLNVGPMITDTETERLTRGFAFCDVLAIGVAYRFGDVTFDIRPNVRHISNGGLQQENAGFNTHNISFGVIAGL